MGVGKSAGKEGGARKVLECWMWLAKRDSPLPCVPTRAPTCPQRPQESTPSLTISTRWRDSNEAHDAHPRAPAATAPGSPPPTWARDAEEGITGGPPPPPRPGAGGCCSSPALLEGPCGVV